MLAGILCALLAACDDAPHNRDQGGNLNSDVIMNVVHDLGDDG